MKVFDYEENCLQSKTSIQLEFIESNNDSDIHKILCKHCKRTLDNGIRCLGMCVADNDY